MIDGIKSLHPYLLPEVWDNSSLLGFGITVDRETGEVMSAARIAIYKGLRFEMRPAITGNSTTLMLNGSLHKYYNQGEHNANDFPFSALLSTITELSTTFGIEPSMATLHGLEVGVNIKLPFSPLRVFKQVVCYRNKPFTQIDKHNKRLGFICCLCDYEVKLYDKQAQSKQLGGYVLRFEIKVKKMRYLRPYQIFTMADLTNGDKIYKLLHLLIEVLQGIVFFDYSIDPKKLTRRELKQYLIFGNPVSWQTMNKCMLTRNRQRLNDLMHKHSRRQLKALLTGWIFDTWNGLFNGSIEAEKMQPFHQLSYPDYANKNATFSHLEYKQEKVAPIINNIPVENEQQNIRTSFNNTSKKNNDIYSAKSAQINCAVSAHLKHCKTCGRDISGQRPASLFCSERIHGPMARKCRNKDSNRRRDYKRIINKAIIMQNFISLTYQVGMATYTDTLHPSELAITKPWLDKITRIDILPTARGEKPETITGKKAKEYLQSLTSKNASNEPVN
jgi:hypothetical protein